MTKIIVDQNRCTECGICTEACPSGIFFGADKTKLPQSLEKVGYFCANCGHCEISCPAGALTLNYRLDEKKDTAIGPDGITPDSLGIYLKKRRSIRHFTGDPVPKEKMCAYAMMFGYPQPQYKAHRLPRRNALQVEWR